MIFKRGSIVGHEDAAHEKHRWDTLEFMSRDLWQTGVNIGLTDEENDRVVDAAWKIADLALKNKNLRDDYRVEHKTLVQSAFYVAMREVYPERVNGRLADKISVRWERYTPWSRLADDIWIEMHTKRKFLFLKRDH